MPRFSAEPQNDNSRLVMLSAAKHPYRYHHFAGYRNSSLCLEMTNDYKWEAHEFYSCHKTLLDQDAAL